MGVVTESITNLLYIIGGVSFLCALWKSLYRLWKECDSPTVKNRDRQGMKDLAYEILKHKNEI